MVESDENESVQKPHLSSTAASNSGRPSTGHSLIQFYKTWIRSPDPNSSPDRSQTIWRADRSPSEKPSPPTNRKRKFRPSRVFVNSFKLSNSEPRYLRPHEPAPRTAKVYQDIVETRKSLLTFSPSISNGSRKIMENGIEDQQRTLCSPNQRLYSLHEKREKKLKH